MRPHGFPPELRIRRGSEFDAVFGEGASASDGLLVVHALPNSGPEPRLGLAVGKALGGAVARNRVKRLLREAFRLRRADLPPGHDLVVVPRADPAEPWSLAACERSLVALAAAAAERRARGAGRRGRTRGPKDRPR